MTIGRPEECADSVKEAEPEISIANLSYETDSLKTFMDTYNNKDVDSEKGGVPIEHDNIDQFASDIERQREADRLFDRYEKIGGGENGRDGSEIRAKLEEFRQLRDQLAEENRNIFELFNKKGKAINEENDIILPEYLKNKHGIDKMAKNLEEMKADKGEMLADLKKGLYHEQNKIYSKSAEPVTIKNQKQLDKAHELIADLDAKILKLTSELEPIRERVEVIPKTKEDFDKRIDDLKRTRDVLKEASAEITVDGDNGKSEDMSGAINSFRRAATGKDPEKQQEEVKGKYDLVNAYEELIKKYERSEPLLKNIIGDSWGVAAEKDKDGAIPNDEQRVESVKGKDAEPGKYADSYDELIESYDKEAKESRARIAELRKKINDTQDATEKERHEKEEEEYWDRALKAESRAGSLKGFRLANGGIEELRTTKKLSLEAILAISKGLDAGLANYNRQKEALSKPRQDAAERIEHQANGATEKKDAVTEQALSKKIGTRYFNTLSNPPSANNPERKQKIAEVLFYLTGREGNLPEISKSVIGYRTEGNKDIYTVHFQSADKKQEKEYVFAFDMDAHMDRKDIVYKYFLKFMPSIHKIKINVTETDVIEKKKQDEEKEKVEAKKKEDKEAEVSEAKRVENEKKREANERRRKEKELIDGEQRFPSSLENTQIKNGDEYCITTDKGIRYVISGNNGCNVLSYENGKDGQLSKVSGDFSFKLAETAVLKIKSKGGSEKRISFVVDEIERTEAAAKEKPKGKKGKDKKAPESGSDKNAEASATEKKDEKDGEEAEGHNESHEDESHPEEYAIQDLTEEYEALVTLEGDKTQYIFKWNDGKLIIDTPNRVPSNTYDVNDGVVLKKGEIPGNVSTKFSSNKDKEGDDGISAGKSSRLDMNAKIGDIVIRKRTSFF